MQIVGERYRLDAELGTGGTATVWLAQDVLADRACAVKLLLPVARGAALRAERLRAEARALEALDHPNVVQILDVGEHEGLDYIVMEYLEGGSLADRLAREGTLPSAEAARVVLEVLDALGAAHEAGIIHRDVKPGNVLLRADGSVVLCDFGIARTDDGGSETATGVALGSLGYMAPEQRLDARRVGPEADLYAAACTLFNLLTGDTPVDLYLAPDHSPRWDAIPAPLRPVLRKATRSEPSARFGAASEMADALEAVLPALASLPAARIKRRETPVGYVPTRADEEPSLRAEQRVRHLDAEEWSWASRGQPVGRSALWVGIAILGIVSMTGLALGPWAERVDPGGAALPAPPRAAKAAASINGSWTGTLDQTPATAVFRGTPDAITGEITLVVRSRRIGSLRVAGRVDPASGEIVLHDVSGPRPASYVARLLPSGLALEGRIVRADGEAPFALARVDGGR